MNLKEENELALAPQQAEPDHDCNYRTGGVICRVCDLNVIKQAEGADTFTAVDMATAAAQEFRDGQAAVEPASAQDEREAFVAWATRLYNTGYLAGHHDTVEAGYTHVYQQDMDSYHEEVVEEWLTDNPQPASLTRHAQTVPRCQCCGYLVTDSEHRGCLRAAAPQPEQSVPEELFDGHAVYQETVRHRRDSGLLVRTSPENVSDTLDAVVRLIKARRATLSAQETNKI